MDTKKVNIIEVAKKRRHIHLLEKMQRGKASMPALSKSEIKELEQVERGPSAPSIVDSQEKVAKVFGVSVRTVANWIKEGMPKAENGTYDLIEIRAWHALRKQRKSAKSGGKNELEMWEMKYRKFKAKLAEVAYKKEIGLLYEKDIVEKNLVMIFTTVRYKFLNIPQQVSPQLEGLNVRQIAEILSSRIKDICKELSTGETLIRISDGCRSNKYFKKLKDEAQAEANRVLESD